MALCQSGVSFSVPSRLLRSFACSIIRTVSHQLSVAFRHRNMSVLQCCIEPNEEALSHNVSTHLGISCFFATKFSASNRGHSWLNCADNLSTSSAYSLPLVYWTMEVVPKSTKSTLSTAFMQIWGDKSTLVSYLWLRANAEVTPYS